MSKRGLVFVLLSLMIAVSATASGCGRTGSSSGQSDPSGSGDAAGGGDQKLVGEGGQWVTVVREPAWVSNPPAKDGVFRFVLLRRSNLVDLAITRNENFAVGDAKSKIAGFLNGAVDEALASKIADAAAGSMIAVAKVVKHTPAPRGKETVPGATLAEAWCLWETPLKPLLDLCPEADRDKVLQKLTKPVSFPE